MDMAEGPSLQMLEEEIERTDKMIQMRVAIEYITEFIDPRYREAFLEAERNAKTVDEMNRVLELAKKYIAQKTVIELLGIEV
jgi:hypothetical protein